MNHADYNNDGYLDIFLMRGGWFDIYLKHPNSLLRNNGNGTFTDVTKEAGLLTFYPTHTSSWADYNLDGYVDLFVAAEHACSQLYHNNGDGTFTDISGNMLCDLGFLLILFKFPTHFSNRSRQRSFMGGL